MSGDCVCSFASLQDGSCIAEDEYLCPMEHDAEGLVKDIDEIAVKWLNDKMGDSAALCLISELVKAYLKRQRGG